MRRDAKEYLKGPYARVLIPADDSFSAEILEFPGCFAQGDSPNEAFENLEKAAEEWIEACWEQGQEIPEPFVNQGFGGKVALRLPRSLHRQAVQMADREGVSLNQFLVSAIASQVGAENLYARLATRLANQMAATAQQTVVYQVFSERSYLPGPLTIPRPQNMLQGNAGTIAMAEVPHA